MAKKFIEKDIKDNKDIPWEVENVEAKSNTTLEHDKGSGQEVILRFFEYTANPLTFSQQMPSAQTLFNAHAKEMEIKLWQDGLVVEAKVEPRILFSKDKTHYKFVIGCRLGRGQILTQKTLTLSELAKC